MQQRRLTLTPTPPYDFRLTMEHLASFGTGAKVNVFEDGHYTRLLNIEGNLILTQVRSVGTVETPRLNVTVHGDEITDEDPPIRPFHPHPRPRIRHPPAGILRRRQRRPRPLPLGQKTLRTQNQPDPHRLRSLRPIYLQPADSHQRRPNHRQPAVGKLRRYPHPPTVKPTTPSRRPRPSFPKASPAYAPSSSATARPNTSSTLRAPSSKAPWTWKDSVISPTKKQPNASSPYAALAPGRPTGSSSAPWDGWTPSPPATWPSDASSPASTSRTKSCPSPNWKNSPNAGCRTALYTPPTSSPPSAAASSPQTSSPPNPCSRKSGILFPPLILSLSKDRAASHHLLATTTNEIGLWLERTYPQVL